MPSDLTIPDHKLFADPQQSKEDKLLELAGINPLTPEIEGAKNLAKGVAVGPFTLGPDTVGLIFDTINATTGFASDYIYGDDRGAWNLPEFNGDSIREAVGMDPGNTWGIVGEAVGGWENALAKGGTAALELFQQAAQHSPDVVMGSIMGAKAARNIKGGIGIQKMQDAERMLREGRNPADVLIETGWFKGEDGKMKFITSDHNVVLNERHIQSRFDSARRNLAEGEETTIYFDLEELLPPDAPLFQGYPNMATMDIAIRVKAGPDNSMQIYTSQFPEGTKAYWEGPTGFGFGGPHGSISILHADDLSGMRQSLLHEIQHAIQFTEDFSTGANAAKFQEVGNMYTSINMQRKMAEAVIDHGVENFRGYDDIWEFLRNYWGPKIDDADELTSVIDSWQPYVESMLGENHEGLQAGLLALAQQEERALNVAAMELRLGNETVTETLNALGQMDNLEVMQRAMQRYLAQGGEAESRLVEYLRDMRLDEIRARVVEARGVPENLTREATESVLRQENFGPADEIDRVNPTRQELVQGQELPTMGNQPRSFQDLRAPVKAHFGFDDSQMEFLQKMVDRDPRLLAKLQELIETGQVAEPLRFDANYSRADYGNRNRGGVDGGLLDDPNFDRGDRLPEGTSRIVTDLEEALLDKGVEPEIVKEILESL